MKKRIKNWDLIKSSIYPSRKYYLWSHLMMQYCNIPHFSFFIVVVIIACKLKLSSGWFWSFFFVCCSGYFNHPSLRWFDCRLLEMSEIVMDIVGQPWLLAYFTDLFNYEVFWILRLGSKRVFDLFNKFTTFRLGFII